MLSCSALQSRLASPSPRHRFLAQIRPPRILVTPPVASDEEEQEAKNNRDNESDEDRQLRLRFSMQVDTRIVQ